MVKITVHTVVPTGFSDTSQPVKSASPSLNNTGWGVRLCWVSANPSAFFEVGSPSPDKTVTSVPWRPSAKIWPRLVGSIWMALSPVMHTPHKENAKALWKNPKFIANCILLPFVLHFYKICWYPWFSHRCTCWLWRVSVQFQFHPLFLVLFCHTNTLDRGKRQEGQGLMTDLRTSLSRRRKRTCLLTHFQILVHIILHGYISKVLP